MNIMPQPKSTCDSARFGGAISAGRAAPVNPGFRGEKRARSYLATQEYVIPKRQFLDVLAAEIVQLTGDQITIFEPGVGPGLVPAHLLRMGVHRNFKRFRYIGTDQNREMLEYANQLCAAAGSAHNGDVIGRVELQLVADMDLTRKSAALYQALAVERVDVVILSQFQHYFPNDNASRLAQKFHGAGRRSMNKSEADRLFHDMLKPGGLLAILDDYSAATVAEHEQNLSRWDAFVVTNLRAPENLARIRAIDPEKADKIAATYCGVETIEALRRCRAARESRREKDNEETWSLANARASLERCYGTERVRVLRHAQLPNFYLLLARKAPEPVALPVTEAVVVGELDQRRVA